MRIADVVPLQLATVTFPDWHPLAGGEGVVRAFLIRHPERPILVDTGVGFGDAKIDEWYQPRPVRIGEALAAHGVSVENVRLVINSHLHFDHSGQNAALGRGAIYVQAREMTAAAGSSYTVREWVQFPGANYVELEGDAEVAPGVRVLATPGHTPGHQSVAVETDDGKVLIAGQAIYSLTEFEHIARTGELLPGDPPPDPDAYLDSARRLVRLGADVVFFSHDEAVYRA